MAVAVVTVTACSSGSPATPAGTTTTTAAPAPASPKAAASPAQPETAAGAKAAAARFFGLCNAGQSAASWTLLPPATRRAIPQAAWVAVHEACPSGAAGLAVRITDVTVTGNTAVVTYQLSGVGAALGSVGQALTYSGGQWWMGVNDPAVYRHGSVKADIAAAKAAGYCAES